MKEFNIYRWLGLTDGEIDAVTVVNKANRKDGATTKGQIQNALKVVQSNEFKTGMDKVKKAQKTVVEEESK